MICCNQPKWYQLEKTTEACGEDIGKLKNLCLNFTLSEDILWNPSMTNSCSTGACLNKYCSTNLFWLNDPCMLSKLMVFKCENEQLTLCISNLRVSSSSTTGPAGRNRALLTKKYG